MWLLAAGFAGLALWRFAETAFGQAGPGGQAVPKRLASLALGVLYGCTCGIMADFILGADRGTSGDTESKSFTARLLAHSGGQVLVVLIGVTVAAAGVGVGIYGLRWKFARYLHTAEMSAPARKVVEGLGVTGYVTRGVVFCVASAFLIDAAVSFDPQKAQGLDGSLRKTAATPLGPWLLFAIALGLAIFGLYSWCEARWRVVEPGLPHSGRQPARSARARSSRCCGTGSSPGATRTTTPTWTGYTSISRRRAELEGE